MSWEKEAWTRLQERAHRQLSPEFAKNTVVLARQKAERRNQAKTMLLTAVICCAGIMSYHWINASVTHRANLKSWNEHQAVLTFLENAY